MYNIPILRYVRQNIQSKRIYIKNNRLKSSTRAVYCSVLTGRLLVNGYKDVKLSYFVFPLNILEILSNIPKRNRMLYNVGRGAATP